MWSMRLVIDLTAATVLLIVSERTAIKATVENDLGLLLVTCFFIPAFAAVIAGGAARWRTLFFCF